MTSTRRQRLVKAAAALVAVVVVVISVVAVTGSEAEPVDVAEKPLVVPVGAEPRCAAGRRRGDARRLGLHAGGRRPGRGRRRPARGGRARPRLRRQQGRPRRPGPRGRRRGVRRADLHRPRVRSLRRPDPPQLARLRGRRRVAAARPAGRARRRTPRRRRRPGGRHRRRLLRRRDLAARRRVRRPGRRHRAGDHLERPGAEPVPAVRLPAGRRRGRARPARPRRPRSTPSPTPASSSAAGPRCSSPPASPPPPADATRRPPPNAPATPPAVASTPRSAPSTPARPPPAARPRRCWRCCGAARRPRCSTGSRRRRCSCRASRTRCSRSTRPTPPPARSRRPAPRWGCAGSTAATTPRATPRSPTDLIEPAKDWFDHYLRGGPDPGTEFEFTLPNSLLEEGPVERREASAYPVDGAGGLTEQRVDLAGGAQPVVSPPGGEPTAVTGLPGTGALLGAAAGLTGAGFRLAAIPGASAVFESQPTEDGLVVVGAPRVRLSVTSSAPDATLFASLWVVTSDGSATLPRQLVSPVHLRGLTPGEPREVEVALPASAYEVEQGQSLRLVVSSTDAAYAVPRDGRVYQVGLADGERRRCRGRCAAAAAGGRRPGVRQRVDRAAAAAGRRGAAAPRRGRAGAGGAAAAPAGAGRGRPGRRAAGGRRAGQGLQQRLPRRRRRELACGAGPGGGPARPQRCRQDHHDADAGGADQRRRRAHPRARPPGDRRRAGARRGSAR